MHAVPFTMLLALSLPDAVLAALTGGLTAGLVSVLAAYLTQQWIAKRESAQHFKKLQLDLYTEVVELILANQSHLASLGSAATAPSQELQLKRLRVSHRLKLLGSTATQEAYKLYKTQVHLEESRNVSHRPEDPGEVDDFREVLIRSMGNDVREK